MQRNNYNTKQKSMILDIIKELDREFTINDIYERLNKEIGLTTIYRLIDNLISTGEVKKIVNGRKTTYQYLSSCDHDNHFFLKCNKCGTTIHVDCDCITELYDHINSKHKFRLDKGNIMINGICSKCSRKGEC